MNDETKEKFQEWAKRMIAEEASYERVLQARQAILGMGHRFAGQDPQLDALLQEEREAALDVAKAGLAVVYYLKSRLLS